MKTASIILTKSASVGKSEQLLGPVVSELQSENKLQRVMPEQVGAPAVRFPQNVTSSFRAELHRSTAVGRARK